MIQTDCAVRPTPTFEAHSHRGTQVSRLTDCDITGFRTPSAAFEALRRRSSKAVSGCRRRTVRGLDGLGSFTNRTHPCMCVRACVYSEVSPFDCLPSVGLINSLLTARHADYLDGTSRFPSIGVRVGGIHYRMFKHTPSCKNVSGSELRSRNQLHQN